MGGGGGEGRCLSGLELNFCYSPSCHRDRELIKEELFHREIEVDRYRALQHVC